MSEPNTTPAETVTPQPDATTPNPSSTATEVAQTSAIQDNRPNPETLPTSLPTAITPDGKLGENWFLALGDEFAPHGKDLSKHKDIRSIITELDYYRKNGVEYPREGSVPQAVDRFRKVAGVPETPEGYGLTAEAMRLPEGMEFDSELATAIASAAHAAHTPPAALMAMAKQFNEVLVKRVADAQAEQAKQAKAAQDQLVSEWRGDFQANASTVRHITSRLAEQAGINPDDPSIAQLANQPAFARMMFQVSKLTAEDKINAPSGYGDLKSPAQKIAEIKAGTDPVWGNKYLNGTREEKLAAYNQIKALSSKIAS